MRSLIGHFLMQLCICLWWEQEGGKRFWSALGCKIRWEYASAEREKSKKEGNNKWRGSTKGKWIVSYGIRRKNHRLGMSTRNRERCADERMFSLWFITHSVRTIRWKGDIEIWSRARGGAPLASAIKSSFANGTTRFVMETIS